MEVYQGHKISGQIAIGTIYLRREEQERIVPETVSDAEAEVTRYEEAVKKAASDLRALSSKAEQNVGAWNARIFEVHAMMTEDVDYREEVTRTIKSKNLCAEYAVFLTGEHFSKMFSDMEDDYFRARAQDVKDITDRLIRTLRGQTRAEDPDEPHILVVGELTPDDLIRQVRSRILGIVTERGTAYSHASILARSMGIPTLSGISPDPSWNGRKAILDGIRGTLIINPDPSTVKEYLGILSERAEREAKQKSSRTEPAVTKNGKRIPLLANIGDLSELETAKQYGAEGIGLLRTEFLFLNAAQVPSEEEQYAFYRKAVETMGDRPVVIRTIDIGADKPARCIPMPEEDNPALGNRAIRISLANRELFTAQLRAIFRAGMHGNVSVLYPMITSEWEMKEIAEIEADVKDSLKNDGYALAPVRRGIMIETPAAAVLSDRLSEYADFFSIGTNDLAQYVLAVDRKNYALERYYNPRHEAIMRLIAATIGNAHKKGIPVSVCGELAADTDVTEQLIALGVDELSVSPSLLTEVRQAIRESNV